MPYMMSRIVDVVTAMESVHIDAEATMMPITFNISVHDTLCDWNEGIYEVSLSSSLTPMVKKISDTSDGNYDVYIEVGSLVLLLMGAVSANELAFEGTIRCDQKWLDYLDIVYPKQKTYINEWW